MGSLEEFPQRLLELHFAAGADLTRDGDVDGHLEINWYEPE